MRVILETMDLLVAPVSPESRETVVSLDPKDPWAWPDLPDPLARPARLADTETVESLDPVAPPAPLACLDPEVPLDPLDPVERRVWVEATEREA